MTQPPEALSKEIGRTQALTRQFETSIDTNPAVADYWDSIEMIELSLWDAITASQRTRAQARELRIEAEQVRFHSRMFIEAMRKARGLFPR